MHIYHRYYLMALALLNSVGAFAQDDRASSSLYLQAAGKADVTVPFAISGEGKRFNPTWGLDLAWINEQNLNKGINHMGIENVGIGRSAFRFTKPLVNDSALASDQINNLRKRATLFNKISKTLPITLTADQEAGADEYYVVDKVANNAHWAAMINSHVHWMQENTEHPVVGISPFNEGDYWSVEEGATPTKQYTVARLLKENYPRCKDIAMVGGNTLNDDKALSWYTPGKQYYDWGNTHQLAGSFDNFAKFFEQVVKDGKVGYADEMHNVGEAMIGLEYGMTVGIWWGFDSRARGEFCQITRHGERLAYAEHRNNWTAASVYRHEDGRVKAFIGSSERQAVTTTYQLVSTERDVYFDGYGPVREYVSVMPGGTGYQKGQTNAERVIDVTWGEDIQPAVIDGVYKIVSKSSGNVVGWTSNGEKIALQKFNANNQNQQWTIKPATNRSNGDLSFYDIESVSNANVRINVKNYATSQGELIAWTQENGPTSNEQWYLEYAGDGYYYLRNRESALYMAANGTSGTASMIQTQMLNANARNRMLFRLLPVSVAYETKAPAQPQGLVAQAQQASVKLTWTANTENDLAGYMIVRSEQDLDNWNTIARKVSGTSFVDNTCIPGHTYLYKVKAIDLADNQSECSEIMQAQPTGEKGLVASWQFDDNLQDATDNMMDVAMRDTPVYREDHKSGSKSLLLSNDNYLQLPYEVACTDELTIAMWVKWTKSTAWQRIFDFGNGSENYMFLTPNTGSVMRFAIKNGGNEQQVNCKSKLPMNQWKHVAVTIGKDRTTIYVDGEEAGSSTGITIRPGDIHPVLNYIGRSQFASDPYFAGQIDDVRIYNYALGADEIKTMMDNNTEGIVSTKNCVRKSEKTTYGIDGRKYNATQRGINIVDGKKVVVRKRY